MRAKGGTCATDRALTARRRLHVQKELQYSPRDPALYDRLQEYVHGLTVQEQPAYVSWCTPLVPSLRWRGQEFGTYSLRRSFNVYIAGTPVTSSWRPGAGHQHPNATRHAVWEAQRPSCYREGGADGVLMHCTDANPQKAQFHARSSGGRDESVSHTTVRRAVRMHACVYTCHME
jgi:hypothetical protein